jgi:hypothetical protein
MKDKCISAQSDPLLSYFQEKDQDRFHNQEAFTALPHSKEGAVRELLSDLTLHNFQPIIGIEASQKNAEDES